MVRLRRVWKLYIFYTTVLIAVMAVAGFTLQGQLKKRLKAHLQEDVLTLAKTVARVLPDSEKPSLLNPWCKEYHAIMGVRVTLVNREGKVIGDSTGEAVAGEIRLDRPEIVEALKQGNGTALRHSDTVKDNMLYVALHVKEKGKVVRLGMPMKKVKAIENHVMGLLALVLFLTPILAMVFSFFFAKHLTPEEQTPPRGSKTKKR